MDRATPATPSKSTQPPRASSKAPPSRPPSVARSVPPVRNEPRVLNSTLTNPQTPNRIRRPLGTMSAQAASVRSVQESPSPTKAISLEGAHLKMRPPPPKMGGTISPISRPQSHMMFVAPSPRLQPPSPTRTNGSTSSASSSMMTGFRAMQNMSYPHRDFSNSSIDAPSVSSTSENWETYDEGSEPEEDYDTPREMRTRQFGEHPHFSQGGMLSQGSYSPSRGRRSGSMSSTMSGKARMYIQQQSQRGQDLIAELMEEVQEVDDEWGEGF